MTAEAVRRAVAELEQCCPLGCDGGACETCPCCSAGWCVSGRDGIPEDPADYAAWLEIAAEHNTLARRLLEVEFNPDQLVMLHRAVRHKLARVRGDMARDKRRGEAHYLHAKARSRYDYAGLLLMLDTMVPEENR